MRVLGIDTSGQTCSACVWQDGAVLALCEETMARGQDARLVPLVQEVIAEAKTEFAQLDRIAVTRGPGSFTGLRIGLATARGLGFAASKPVIGVNRFDIHAAQQSNHKPLLIILDSKRLELFCRLYPATGAAQEPAMLTPDEIVTLINANPEMAIAGDASAIMQPIMVAATFLPLVESEAVTASKLAATATIGDAANLPRPLYLRAPDVTFPNKKTG